MSKYCVKKNPDGTYRLARKGMEKPPAKTESMVTTQALEKKIEDTKKGK